jgi:HEAT repeat protein
VRGADTEGVELRLALELAAAGAVLAWLLISLVAVVGRIGHDWRRRVRPGHGLGPRRARLLLRRAGRHRGEAGKWRRIAALDELARTRHPRSRALLRRALRDPDRDVAGASVRALGELGVLGEAWAVDALLEALRHEWAPRSRVATQLDRLTPGIGPRLVRLLDEQEPGVRFWAATLLGSCPGVGRDGLVALTQDLDPNVRAAATESLGERVDLGVLDVLRERLQDEAWFVRVHACRALGRLGTAREAASVARCLADPWWWVRAAAKDALRGFGLPAARVLLRHLDDADGFARNGAAEVLLELGVVEQLAPYGAQGELRERILQAGGERVREAARLRGDEERAREGAEAAAV